MQRLNGKVAAITGAASGIGLECARAMLAQGATVVLIDRAEDRLVALCAELGPTALPLVVDLLDGPQVSVTCHWSFIQRRPEPGGHLRLSARVEQSPGARNFHRVQRDGRLRLSGAGGNLRGFGSRGPNGALQCCSR